jgi:hypothetical protein
MNGIFRDCLSKDFSRKAWAGFFNGTLYIMSAEVINQAYCDI